MSQKLTLFSSEILRITNLLEGSAGVWGGTTTEIWIQDLNTGLMTDFMPFTALSKGFQSYHVELHAGHDEQSQTCGRLQRVWLDCSMNGRCFCYISKVPAKDNSSKLMLKEMSHLTEMGVGLMWMDYFQRQEEGFS